MNKISIALVCILILMLGGLAWELRNPNLLALAAQDTKESAGEMKDTLESVTARIETQDAKVKTEVRVIHATVREKVNALPPDDISAGLNAELAMFRGMEGGAPGLDGD